MKIGEVEVQNGLLYPNVGFDIVGSDGRVKSFSGTLDTGFTGWVALPGSEIDELGLRFSHDDVLTLADNRTVHAPLYMGEVLLADRWERVFVVQIGATPLVGTGLVRNSLITLDMVSNGDIDYVAHER